MKLLLGTLFALCLSITLQAQNTDLFKRNPMKEYKLKRLLQDSLQRVQPVVPPAGSFVPADPGILKFTLKGRYIGENGKGDEIYAMQPDNMPCLVPGRKVDPKMVVPGMDRMDRTVPFFKKQDEKPGDEDGGKQD